MKHTYPQRIALANNQKGATLIIVLVVVLLVSIVAAITVRNSQTAADMSTAAQVKQLLVQSSDLPLAKLQTASIEPYCDTAGGCAPVPANTPVSQLDKMDETGPLDMFRTNSKDYQNAEFVLCYQPLVRDGLFSGKSTDHRIILGVDTSSANSGVKNINAGRDGYCHIANSSDPQDYYTSKRGVVAAQVSLTRPTVNDTTNDDVDLPPFTAANFGTDATSSKRTEALYVRSYVTSVMPSMAIDSTVANIDDCLQKPIGGALFVELASTPSTASAPAINVPGQVECLNNEDVPMDIQVQDFVFYSQ